MRSILFILLVFMASCGMGQSANGVSTTKANLSPADSAYFAQMQSAARVQYSTDSTAKVQRSALITSLKSQAYKSLQGVTVGGTLTAAQLQAAAWVSLWNTGAINPATNKIDSTLNYIK